MVGQGEFFSGKRGTALGQKYALKFRELVRVGKSRGLARPGRRGNGRDEIASARIVDRGFEQGCKRKFSEARRELDPLRHAAGYGYRIPAAFRGRRFTRIFA